jgi:hypothetical protein
MSQIKNVSSVKDKSSVGDFACVAAGLENGQVVVKGGIMPPDVALLLAAQIITVARDAILQTECEHLAEHQS